MTSLSHPLYESPQKEANEAKYGHRSQQCISCFKPLKEGETKMVHMNTDWEAMHVSILTEEDAQANGMESQGAFPIGNSCAKKMPKEYVHPQ